jgi:hypothetical protein
VPSEDEHHSGAQKNFVEQLWEDLERAKQSPLFDKRPESLLKGEVFARHIFRAPEQCALAVVVVSDEYFSRSKWPMLELCAFVKWSKCKVILPLFFGLSCKDFGNLERRERWFETWHAWAQADARNRVEDWKNSRSNRGCTFKLQRVCNCRGAVELIMEKKKNLPHFSAMRHVWVAVWAGWDPLEQRRQLSLLQGGYGSSTQTGTQYHSSVRHAISFFSRRIQLKSCCIVVHFR